MSGSRYDAPLLSVLGGGGAAGVLGALGGLIVAVVSWPRSELIQSDAVAISSLVIAGLVVGGVIGLAVGFAMAFHGGIIGWATDRAEGARIWGVFTGVICGIAVAPVLGGAVGLGFGHMSDGGVLGVFLGPILGIASWQAGFWLAEYKRSSRA